MKKRLLYLATIFLLFATQQLRAQIKIGDNPKNIDPNVLFEMESTNKGMVLPRMTAVQRNAIANPSPSMLIYNTTEGCINIYSAADKDWRSVCGEKANGSAEYTIDCSSLVVSGKYTTGVALDPDSNYLTISVNVTELGTYNIFCNSGSMYFADAGTFTTLGDQEITLKGQGYPQIAGTNFIALNLNGNICSTVINVANGLAVVSGCGTQGILTGTITANVAISPSTVYKSYAPGPAYSGGVGVYGITSSASNGIRISSPVNGTFISSGAPIDYVISGTPLQAGNTTINYSINGFACSFSVPVLSGSGTASAVDCTPALAGTYQVGTPLVAGNTKQIKLVNVVNGGTFYVRTNTVNGYYFEGSATLTAGLQILTLTAKGTPLAAQTDNFTVIVSSSATTFTTPCSFNVTVTLPATVPDYPSLNCGTLSNSISYIKADNTGSTDYFGGYLDAANARRFAKSTKISADGLTLAVGALNEGGSTAGGSINPTDNNSALGAGAVYIYTRLSLTANWVFQARIKGANTGAGDNFGNSVSLSNNGNTMVVGAYHEYGSGTKVNPADDNLATNAGAAYVFVRTGSTWSQQAYLKAYQVTANDLFGTNVAISGDGNTVAVGAVGEDGNGGISTTPVVNELASAAGAVYTYKRSVGGSTWSFDSYIKPNNVGPNKEFGSDVSLNDDGTTLAVGAWYEDGSNAGINPLANISATDAGAAYIFKKGTSWTQEAYIKASNPTAGDNFGASVSVDGTGNTLVVGARFEDGSGKGVNPVSNESAGSSGAAYVYSRTGTNWTQQAYLKAINPTIGDSFGASVAVSNNGQFILVGAPYEDASTGCVNGADNNTATDKGAAYMYSLVGGTWQYSFVFRIPTSITSAGNDKFGTCVSINDNGRSSAFAAPLEDGSGKLVNPAPNNSLTDPGCVMVYTK
jgi:hypothetical protein